MNIFFLVDINYVFFFFLIIALIALFETPLLLLLQFCEYIKRILRENKKTFIRQKRRGKRRFLSTNHFHRCPVGCICPYLFETLQIIDYFLSLYLFFICKTRKSLISSIQFFESRENR